MSVRRCFAGALLGLGLVVFTPAAASADPPHTTPGQSGEQGCPENGQAISGAAGENRPFGQVVRQNAPIADNNAQFFSELCD